MTARSFTLPNEDPAVAQQLADDWDASYRPQDPAERHFVTLCVGAEILSGRALLRTTPGSPSRSATPTATGSDATRRRSPT